MSDELQGNQGSVPTPPELKAGAAKSGRGGDIDIDM